MQNGTPRGHAQAGNLAGIGRPTRALLEKLGRKPREARNLAAMMDDFTATDALARLLTEAIEKHQKTDGRVDMKDVAQHVLAEMKRHPR